MDELLQAGQELDPLREMQFDMAGNIGGLAFINGPPFWVISARNVSSCDQEFSRRDANRIFE